MTPLSTESTTARATAACAGPNICTACFAPLIVTLLNRIVSGLAARLGVTTARSVVKPSLLLVSAWRNAAPAGPCLEPMTRSMCATSLPSPTSDSPRKKSAAMWDNSFQKKTAELRLRSLAVRVSRCDGAARHQAREYISVHRPPLNALLGGEP